MKQYAPLFEDCDVVDGENVDQIDFSSLIDVVGMNVITFCCSFAADVCAEYGL